MKRFLAFFLSLLILLSLCGCMRGGLHSPGTTAPITNSTDATMITETTEPAPTRPAKVSLEFFLEGMTEYQDATLYVGNGYSLYITDDGWLEIPGENGKMTWQSSYNPDISFTVIPHAGTDLAQTRDVLLGEYTLNGEDGEYVYGSNDSGLFYRAVRLIETPDGILAAVWNYSLEATEGFGARLRVLAGTLQATD